MGGGGIWFSHKYTPMYEKGIKKTQIKTMETATRGKMEGRGVVKKTQN